MNKASQKSLAYMYPFEPKYEPHGSRPCKKQGCSQARLSFALGR
jgi:hypothetical protein